MKRASAGVRPTISEPTIGHAVALGLGPDALEDAVERGLLVVRHVDRDLDLPAVGELDAHRLDVAEAAADVPDRLGDAVGHGEVLRAEVDVVGDQRRAARPTATTPAVGCGRSGPKSGFQSGALHLLGEALELPLSDLREVAPALRRGRVLVEVDRDAEPLGDLLARRGARAPHTARPSRPRIGMNGTTSTAPMRGCSPECRVRSIRGSAASNRASTAARTPSASPTSVRTLRLCEASEDTSSRRTPGAARTARRRSPRRGRGPAPRRCSERIR